MGVSAASAVPAGVADGFQGVVLGETVQAVLGVEGGPVDGGVVLAAQHEGLAEAREGFAADADAGGSELRVAGVRLLRGTAERGGFLGCLAVGEGFGFGDVGEAGREELDEGAGVASGAVGLADDLRAHSLGSLWGT